MKKAIYLLIICILSLSSNAQTYDEYRKEYVKQMKQYVHNRQKSYDAYRDSLNREFVEYMRKAWVKHEPKAPKPIPIPNKPVAPIVKAPDTPPTHPFGKEIKPMNIIEPTIEIPTPGIVRPKLQPIKSDAKFKFNYYGTTCSLPLDNTHRFTLSGTNENAVADAWLILSQNHYRDIISECLLWKDFHNMCDWGYVEFVEQACNSFFGAERTNESCLMQMFILTQSGYMVRIARIDNKLSLLLPSEAEIFQYPYLEINGYRYYIYNKEKSNSCYLLDYSFPKEKTISLYIQQEQLFAYSATKERRLTSDRYKEASVTITENKNLIDFLASYPLSNTMTIYTECKLSSKAQEQLYPPLRKAIEGKSEGEAADILLNFVQTAFEYKTDGEFFGIEKPQFADETLFYPYCDCEDRSILYSLLIRDLLGLDVVLLDYPGHIATAVKFNDRTITGDYYTIDGEKYFVCDPTYINAGIGTIMPQYKNTQTSIIKL